MALIGANIRVAYAEPNNAAAREAMMLGATEAGLAFSNSSVALVHGMSRPIGAHFHVPHGLSNAMLLPAITRFSLPGAAARYAEASRRIGFAASADSDAIAAAKLVTGLEALNRDLSVPTPADYGIGEATWTDKLPLMAEQALASGSPANNPVVPTAAEIVGLYRDVWVGTLANR
jgi:alcohol dehydrogenase class IV